MSESVSESVSKSVSESGGAVKYTKYRYDYHMGEDGRRWDLNAVLLLSLTPLFLMIIIWARMALKCSFKLLSSLTPLFLLLHHFARDGAANEHRSLEIGVDHVGDRLGRG